MAKYTFEEFKKLRDEHNESFVEKYFINKLTNTIYQHINLHKGDITATTLLLQLRNSSKSPAVINES